MASASMEPRIAKAGRDVQENSGVLQRWVGAPEAAQPYSPAASAAARQASVDEHGTPWWLGALGALAGILTGAGGLRMLSGRALAAGVEGVSRALAHADENGNGAVRAEDLRWALKDSQERAGVREHVRKVARRVEARTSSPSPSPTPAT